MCNVRQVFRDPIKFLALRWPEPNWTFFDCYAKQIGFNGSQLFMEFYRSKPAFKRVEALPLVWAQKVLMAVRNAFDRHFNSISFFSHFFCTRIQITQQINRKAAHRKYVSIIKWLTNIINSCIGATADRNLTNSFDRNAIGVRVSDIQTQRCVGSSISNPI